MKIEQLFQESFSKMYPLGQMKTRGRMISYPFTTETGDHYQVEFFKIPTANGMNIYEVSFALEDGTGDVMWKRPENTSSTNSGNPMIIITTVIHAMLQFTRSNSVDALFFDGATPGLEKLYARMLKTFQTPGFHVHTVPMRGGQNVFIMMNSGFQDHEQAYDEIGGEINVYHGGALIFKESALDEQRPAMFDVLEKKAEDILYKYATGEYTSVRAQKELRKLGYKADLKRNRNNNRVDLEDIKTGQLFTVEI